MIVFIAPVSQVRLSSLLGTFLALIIFESDEALDFGVHEASEVRKLLMFEVFFTSVAASSPVHSLWITATTATTNVCHLPLASTQHPMSVNGSSIRSR
ncbi:hypothetical protein C8Q75DRAFT_250692 [Abortiporus biennis]|nr:hypothetical protein C8Q75DRAFT_250692 [Abortiporus biennis]